MLIANRVSCVSATVSVKEGFFEREVGGQTIPIGIARSQKIYFQAMSYLTSDSSDKSE